MGKIADIEAEFDEPFTDVIKGFATMGYSRKATAEILEINLSYFRELCTRYDLHRYFKKQKDMRPECRKGGGVGWPKGKKKPFKPRRYTDEVILSEVRKWDTYSSFCTCALMHPSTVVRRFRKPWREIISMAHKGA